MIKARGAIIGFLKSHADQPIGELKDAFCKSVLKSDCFGFAAAGLKQTFCNVMWFDALSSIGIVKEEDFERNWNQVSKVLRLKKAKEHMEMLHQLKVAADSARGQHQRFAHLAAVKGERTERGHLPPLSHQSPNEGGDPAEHHDLKSPKSSNVTHALGVLSGAIAAAKEDVARKEVCHKIPSARVSTSISALGQTVHKMSALAPKGGSNSCKLTKAALQIADIAVQVAIKAQDSSQQARIPPN